MRNAYLFSALSLTAIAALSFATESFGRTLDGKPGAASPAANGAVKISGLVFKHNDNSNMRFNLEMSGAQGAGYVLVGQTDATYKGGGKDGRENVDVSLESLVFAKVGPTSSKGDLTVDEKSKLFSREGSNGGELRIQGRQLGTRTIRGSLAGIEVDGQTAQVKNNGTWGTPGNAIVFDRLSVGRSVSNGKMAYYYGRYEGYYSEANLRFGKYEIHALDPLRDKDDPIMSYDKRNQFMAINLLFGNFIVKGGIQFRDSDETRYQQVLVSRPTESARLYNEGMMNKLYSRKGSFAHEMGKQQQRMAQIGMMMEGTTRTEVRTQAQRVIVATEGNYSLIVTRKDGKPIAIDSDVDKEGADEEALRALLAFLEITVYDSFSE